MLDVITVLVHDQVFTKTFDSTVQLEFLSAIAALSRRGKNLHNQGRIDNYVAMIAGVMEIATDHTAVRVSVETDCNRLDPQIGVESTATWRNLSAEDGASTIRQQRVIGRSCSHSKHLAVVELTLCFGSTLDAKILFLC